VAADVLFDENDERVETSLGFLSCRCQLEHFGFEPRDPHLGRRLCFRELSDEVDHRYDGAAVRGRKPWEAEPQRRSSPGRGGRTRESSRVKTFSFAPLGLPRTRGPCGPRAGAR